MKRYLAITCILTGAMLAGGCATKKYVRQTTAPIQSKVDQVGEQTAKQAQEIQESRSTIKQVDDRATSGISAAQERAATAEKSAGEAMQRANQATDMAKANTEAVNSVRNSLQQVVANLDDYKVQNEVTIPFKFDKSTLDDQAKQELDNLAKNVSNTKRYFIAVEGFTDRTGPQQYNEALSRRRADAVVRYLVAQHNVPVYRIHMIGLGEEKPVEEGRTRAARAKNRRVEVRLFTADLNLAQGQSGTTGSQDRQQPPSGNPPMAQQ